MPDQPESFNEQTWKDRIRQRLQGWSKPAAHTLYGFLATMSLFPVVEALQRGQVAPVFIALGSVAGSVGAGLLTNLVQEWARGDKSQDEVISELEALAQQDEEIREALDAIMTKLEVMQMAEAGLDDEDRAWFVQTLREELERLGNWPRYEATLVGSGAQALGSGTKAGGERAVVGDDISAPVITGDDNTLNITIFKETSTHRSSDEKLDEEELGRRYLAQLKKQTGYLSLEAIDPQVADTESARISLAAVYTALLTLSPEAHERLEREQITEREVRKQSALAAFNAHKRLVLLGDPGSGKSTFVDFMALCMANELLGHTDQGLALLTAPLPDEEGNDQEERQPWEHGALWPVRIILRDFIASGVSDGGRALSVEDIWRFLEEELKPVKLDSFVPMLRHRFRKKGGVFLFDGLDEVPEAANNRQRNRICQLVQQTAETYPKCRVLVTSRAYAYRSQDWALSDFETTALAPFSRGQIIRFVDRWYAYIGRLRELRVEEISARVTSLKQAILQNDRLYTLARRPLLLTLMASLHAWRGGALPDRREQLYREAVDLLLYWWEQRRIVKDERGQPIVMQPSLAEFLKVDREDLLRELNALAYQAHAAQPELVGTADIAEEKLVTALMSICRDPDARPQRLIEYLEDRAGLLTPRGVKVYTFPHRTFQEYLAASHLTDDDYPDKLADLVRRDPDRWREVALLAAAKAASGAMTTIWSLAEALCPHAPPQDVKLASDEDLWGAFVAALALAESADLKRVSERNQDKLDRVRQWTALVIGADRVLSPSDRTQAGNALAKLGDPRPGVGLNAQGLPDILWAEPIKPGPFIMGNTKETDPMAYDDEAPQFTCNLITEPYRISVYPITVAQYRAFIEAGGYDKRQYWTDAGWKWKLSNGVNGPTDYGIPFNLDNHPQVGVSWYEAVAFCNWLSEVTGLVIQLPTEAQWERAARHTDGRRYPWSPDPQAPPDPNRMNYEETGIGATSAVGVFPAGGAVCGAQDMSGNVWEWCRTQWRNNYENYEQGVKHTLEGNERRVLRGGSFYGNGNGVRAAFRHAYDSDIRINYVGFRVVLLPPFPSDL